MNSIERLTDELLISIVSLLPVKDAGKTSVLARRWRYLWVYTTNLDLDFDDSEMVRSIKWRVELIQDENASFNDWISKTKILEVDRTRYVGWVNRVLNLHSNGTIDKFRVFFDLNKSHAHDIDTWIKFAFRKRVKRLELNVMGSYGHLFPKWHWSRYTFPNICHGLLLGESTCETLVSLCLTKVDVDEEVVEYFISNCPLLEELRMENVDRFRNLRPSCEATQLRQLAIINCQNFKRLQIWSPNLVSLTCIGHSFPIINLRDASSVVHLSIGGISFWQLSEYLFPMILESRLETLTVQLASTIMVMDPEVVKFPKLPRLKKLVLDVSGCCRKGHFCLTPLLNVAPQLHEVRLKLPRTIATSTGRNYPRQKHQCLKVFEIELTSHDDAEVPADLDHYVREHTSSLQKLIINGKALTGKNLDALEEIVARFADCADSLVVNK